MFHQRNSILVTGAVLVAQPFPFSFLIRPVDYESLPAERAGHQMVPAREDQMR